MTGGRTPQEREVADEVAFHLEMRTRELIARGVPPADARRQAEAQIADPAALERVCVDLAAERDRRRSLANLAGALVQDARHGLRRLWRRRRASAVAVATMALGIGAATAIYSVVDTVLLKPLPFAEPDRLVSIWVTDERWRTDPVLAVQWDRIPLGRFEYDPLVAQATTIAEAGMWNEVSAMLSQGDGPMERVRAIRVTTSLLPLLRIAPARGRLLRAGEDVLNGPKVALLGWEAWRARFRADEGVIGRSIVLDDVAYEIVGVLPAGVRLTRTAAPPDLWLPALQDQADLPQQRNRSYRALGRLAAGADPPAAEREAAAAFRGQVAAKNAIGARVERWQQDETRTVRASMVMLLGAVGLLLAIACVNVAMVTLADAATREREIASRIALGASTGRLVRQVATEGLVLGAVAAPVGCLLAWAGVHGLVALAPPGVPGIADAALSARALCFAAGLVGVTGLLIGLAPAAVVGRRDAALAASSARHTRRGAARLQRMLIGAEVTLSVLLLVGCGLLGHSLSRLRNVEVGFQPDDLRVVQIAATRSFWRDPDRQARYFEQAVEAVRATPGVIGVATASSAPFASGGSSSSIHTDGGGAGQSTQQRWIAPEYFEVTQTPLLAGRGLTAADGSSGEPVAMLSASAARRDFGGQSPIGRKVRWQGQWRTIVGVVGDVQFSRLSDPVQPAIYGPLTPTYSGSLVLIVRTAPGHPGVVPAIRERLIGLDRSAAIQRIDEVSTLIARSYAEERYRASLVTIFGLIASALAGVGVFAVASRSVAARQREAGIRLALGASAGAVARALTREVVVGVIGGIVSGLGAGALLARWLAPQLFGVSAADAIAFSAAIAVMAVAVLLALVAPLRRATRVDPVDALRGE